MFWEPAHPCILSVDHFTVLYLAAKPLIWSEAKGDLVMIEGCLQNEDRRPKTKDRRPKTEDRKTKTLIFLPE